MVCLEQHCRDVLENALSASGCAVVVLPVPKLERLRGAFLSIYDRAAGKEI